MGKVSEESVAVIVYVPAILRASPVKVTTPATAVSEVFGPGCSETLPGLAPSETASTSLEPEPVVTRLP